MDIKRPRGTQDVLPKDINKWNYVETLFKKYARILVMEK